VPELLREESGDAEICLTPRVTWLVRRQTGKAQVLCFEQCIADI
jgi:hypothetical protein